MQTHTETDRPKFYKRETALLAMCIHEYNTSVVDLCQPVSRTEHPQAHANQQHFRIPVALQKPMVNLTAFHGSNIVFDSKSSHGRAFYMTKQNTKQVCNEDSSHRCPPSDGEEPFGSHDSRNAYTRCRLARYMEVRVSSSEHKCRWRKQLSETTSERTLQKQICKGSHSGSSACIKGEDCF